MPFALDRDLLIVEPTLLNDLPFPSQQRLSTLDAQISGVTLTSASSDFITAQIDAGQVLLVNEQPVEVVSRTNATTLTVSLLRALPDDEPIAPGNVSEAQMVARTFLPQIHRVQDALLRAMGVEDPAVVYSTSTLQELVTLGTLANLFDAAAAVNDEHSDGYWRKAQRYRQRFQTLCRQTLVLLDENQDGLVDATRRLGVVQLLRS